MVVYKVTVATGTSEYSGTINYIYLTLIGEAGQSERTVLDNEGLDLYRGAVDEYEITSPVPLGPLRFVRLEKCRYLVEDNWFCRFVSVRTPEGNTHSFPCYRWLVGEAGNIYLMDYAILDGLPANVIQGKQQHLTAPLCLLYEHPDKGLIPLAIQLGQTPGPSSPVFLPSDPPLAWLLSKIWVRSSEFQIFQVLTHLLRTHLMMEVFCVATLRQLPAVHPVYKVSSTGGPAVLLLSQKGYQTLSYESLQPPLDFQRRGVMKLRDYFYREDSLMLWNAIQSYVSGLVSIYYSSDSDVTQDSELQLWIRDITEEGFGDIPQFGEGGGGDYGGSNPFNLCPDG
ncbi:Arachidonate 12-lipoxygenase, 12R-type [Acipenser ruthenus]|uniref:Arachidonate 12-lipoxygenase, 12R-type n=1 Tax=Acipenser ruthenus TaxID=7906 RepID=A0A444UTA8_ACIRT|nr:Arachidonate 12-lipoxygenase, 12R-type [Acipenser ruthenus]